MKRSPTPPVYGPACALEFAPLRKGVAYTHGSRFGGEFDAPATAEGAAAATPKKARPLATAARGGGGPPSVVTEPASWCQAARPRGVLYNRIPKSGSEARSAPRAMASLCRGARHHRAQSLNEG